MRALMILVPTLVGCTSENVQPLIKFGAMTAYVQAELGPLAADDGSLDVNPRIFVEFAHNAPACPVLGDDIDVSIDGKRPDSFEHGYYDEGGGYGHDTGASCQSPYFSINKVPPPLPRSVLRLRDSTADYSLEVDRLFVNPELTIATPLVHGQAARLDVADDREIKNVKALWWVGDAESALGYDVHPTIAPGAISFTMPADASGPGWFEVRFDVAAPELSCNGFAMCAVQIKGSAKIDATVD